MAERGRFLVLEGIDGCGKTTQLEQLRTWLPASGLLPAGAELVLTREPGGTALGQALRALLLHPPGDAAPGSTAELLLYAADRAQHVQQRIEPALAAGHWVLSDRFSGSTAAYQGYARANIRAHVAEADRIEASGEAFLQRVCDGFATLAAQPGWCRLDASQPPEQVSAAIQRAISQHCALPAGPGTDLGPGHG